MSESAEKTSTFGDSLPHAGIHLGSSSDDFAKADSPTNTPSQILLEALRNFVIPIIHTAEGKNNKDIGNLHSMGPEAGKLLAALQEFISSMVVQLQVSQTQRIEVDLGDPDVGTVSSNDAMVKSPGVATKRKLSDPGPSKAFIPQQTEYQSFMGRLLEAVREHVFSKMPIRLLHFTDAPRGTGTKLQMSLLERNDVCGLIIQDIQASFSERVFKERMVKARETRGPGSGLGLSLEDRIIKEIVQENTKYAILSHTWLRGSDREVTYSAWQLGQFDAQQPGYQKLVNFCRSACKDHGLSFGWMDTVCINKNSSSELDESIRSMYKWYKNSHICVSYLAETVALGDIHRDPWFTRGWTFQELLAPEYMAFYKKDWKTFVPYTLLGDKCNPAIIDQIFKATTITGDELRRGSLLPISRKMQLAAKRNVMREEDIAYSLMGICDVSISIAYGEGAKRAFFRLMTEILNTSSKVADIFNCAQPGWSIIPSGPSAYLQCSKVIMTMTHRRPIEPLLLTHVGLRMPILLMPSLRGNSYVQHEPIGDYYATFEQFKGRKSSSNAAGIYHLLDKGLEKSTSDYNVIFGMLNFNGDTTTIRVPDLCLAVYFALIPEDKGRTEWPWSFSSYLKIRIDTDEPVVFRLMKQGMSTSGDGKTFYSIKRSDLAKHGMTLETMYL